MNIPAEWLCSNPLAISMGINTNFPMKLTVHFLMKSNFPGMQICKFIMPPIAGKLGKEIEINIHSTVNISTFTIWEGIFYFYR
jgi:hypothetical protein